MNPEYNKPRSLRNFMSELMEAFTESKNVFIALDLENTLVQETGIFSELTIPDILIDSLNTLASADKVDLLLMTTRPSAALGLNLNPGILIASNYSQRVTVKGIELVNPSMYRIRNLLNELKIELDESIPLKVDDFSLQVNTIDMKRADAISLYRHIIGILSDKGLDESLHTVFTPYGIFVSDSSWDKGRILEMILSQLSVQPTVIYIGDDSTDEPAFAFTNSIIDSWSIVVMRGSKETEARYYLDNMNGVHSLLLRLAQALSTE